MAAKPENLATLVDRLEAEPALHGLKVADVAQMSGFQFHYRRIFYRQAMMFLGLAILNSIGAALNDGFLQAFSLFGFAISFVMMFRCEFNARLITRQLHRPAAEQLARDLLEIND